MDCIVNKNKEGVVDYKQYINYIAVDILEVLGIDTNDEVVGVIESILHKHSNNLKQKAASHDTVNTNNVLHFKRKMV